MVAIVRIHMECSNNLLKIHINNVLLWLMLDFLFYLFYFLETNTLKREKGIHTHTHTHTHTHNVSLFIII